MLIPEKHLDEEPGILERLRRGERIDHYETMRRRKDGTLINVSLTVSPIKDENGRIVGASKIARDITRQKRSEELIREQAHVLALLDTTGKSIASNLDLQNVLQTVTDTATHLTGAKFGAFFYNVIDEQGEAFLLYTLSGAPREAFEKLGLPRNTPVFAHLHRPGPRTFAGHHQGSALRHDGAASRNAEGPPAGTQLSGGAGDFALRRGDGRPLLRPSRRGHICRARRTQSSAFAAQAAVAMDNARLYEAAQREIASRERAEAALREMDQRKDEFLATLAHELRNPLAPIRQATLISMSPRPRPNRNAGATR